LAEETEYGDVKLDGTILYWAAAIVAVGSALLMLWKLVKPLCNRVHNAIDTWEHFMRDWAGEPAAPGRSAVPGVMERLNRIDGELKRNGGSSMKDALNRVEKKLDQIDNRLEDGNKRFDTIETELFK
jgi:hypothetical protein